MSSTGRALIASHPAPDGGAAGAGAPPVDLEEAFRRYAPLVASIALRIMGRHHEVEDLVQEVFLDAWRGLSGIRQPEAIKSWLITVTARTARRRLRMRRVREFLGLEDEPRYEEVKDPSLSPLQQAMVARVYRALDRLPVESRLAWTLRIVEDIPLQEVAAILGCSTATAKRRVAEARKLLAEEVG